MTCLVPSFKYFVNPDRVEEPAGGTPLEVLTTAVPGNTVGGGGPEGAAATEIGASSIGEGVFGRTTGAFKSTKLSSSLEIMSFMTILSRGSTLRVS